MGALGVALAIILLPVYFCARVAINDAVRTIWQEWRDRH